MITDREELDRLLRQTILKLAEETAYLQARGPWYPLLQGVGFATVAIGVGVALAKAL